MRPIEFKFDLGLGDLPAALINLNRLHNNCTPYFRNTTRSVKVQSRQYLDGLLLNVRRGNISLYSEKVPNCNSQSLNHFISDSPWLHLPLIDQIQVNTTDFIGNEAIGSLHLDESGMSKSGKCSVGVKRQYNGNLGKVDSCQVGVFLGYVNESYRTLIDARLYLPEDWCEDPERREKCVVPSDVVFKTKAELGLEMLLHAIENNVPFGWVGMDAFYGQQPRLRDRINREGIIYVADIPANTRVWLSPPKVGIPERKGNRGRVPTKVRLLEGEPRPIEVRKLKDQLEGSQWHHVFVRDTERKKLWTNIACIRVFPVVDELPGEEVWLIIRIDDGEKDIKYQFSNAPIDTTIKQFAKMSYSRYWIERAFQDAKGIAGLADYQVRSWTAWHHHITMSLLAMLAILMIRIDLGRKAELLTVQDVKEILEVILPQKEITAQEVLNLIKKKHKKRYSARISHHKRQKSLIKCVDCRYRSSNVGMELM